MQIYAILDRKAERIIHALLVEWNHTTALRAFRERLADQSSPLSRYPEDFRLLHIGTLADNGAITPITDLDHIIGYDPELHGSLLRAIEAAYTSTDITDGERS